MKLWQSVSTKIMLLLLAVVLCSVVGLSLTLELALRQFFIQEAQASLRQQANSLAIQTRSQWNNETIVRRLADLTSQQAGVQVIIFDSTSIRLISQDIEHAALIKLPPDLISKTLAGERQAGKFRISNNANHPWWLYTTAPIRDLQSNQMIGAVYVAMPLRRPRQFAHQVKGLVMGIAIAAATKATVIGLLLSRILTQPLKALYRQAQRLEAGDYTARSVLKGQDELAQLSNMLDQMAAKLVETLAALQAQEIARRELVASVSHDLRTPLAAMRVELEAVLDGIVTGEKAQLYLQRAFLEIDYLNRLVEQLLLLAKADSGQLPVQPQVVSAIAIAQECIFRMEPCATQVGLKLEMCVFSNATVWIDPELTGQAILNLLENAIKYASESEVICVKILPPVEKERQHYVPLQVKDWGKGIDEKMLQHVTERFYRSNGARPRGGQELGLAIAQHICQIQGGNLQIESEVGKGTVVTLFLPATA